MNNHFEELKKYIKDNLASGHTEEDIKKTLIEHNWDPQMVNAGFESIHRDNNGSDNRLPTSPASHQAQESSSQTSVHQTGPNQSPTQQAKNHPKKYKVFRAIADLVSAIKNNASTFFVSVIGSFFVVGLVFYILFFIFYRLIPNNEDTFSTSTASFIVSTLGFFVGYIIWYVFAHALILSTTSLALKSGIENKATDIASNIKYAISKILRVILADTLVTAIAFLPFILIIVIPTILFLSGQGGGSSTFGMLAIPLLMLAGIIWAFIALLRFSMAPYIALFEPEVPILKTLGRSKHLLAKGGQWFLIKGFFLMFFVVVIFGVISGQALNQLSSTEDTLSMIFVIIINVTVNGVLTMLYFNRKAIRK